MSTPEMKALAEQHAAKVAFYIEAQTLSADFVRSDVPRRDRMLAEFAQSDNALRMETNTPGTFTDIEGMLQACDTKLAQAPVTFEDHMSRMHYAFSAYILFQVHVIDKLSVQDPKFNRLFMRSLSRRLEPLHAGLLTAATYPPDRGLAVTASYDSAGSHSQSKPQPNESTGREIIATKADALKLLQDTVRLMQLRFVLSPDTPSEELWRIGGINLRPNGKTQYMVLFAGIPDELPYLEDELLRMLCDSAIEHVV